MLIQIIILVTLLTAVAGIAVLYLFRFNDKSEFITLRRQSGIRGRTHSPYWFIGGFVLIMMYVPVNVMLQPLVNQQDSPYPLLFGLSVVLAATICFFLGVVLLLQRVTVLAKGATKQQQKLQQNQLLLRTILDAMPIGVAMTTPEGDSYINKHVSDILNETLDADQFAERFGEKIHSVGSDSSELQLTTHDNRNRIIEVWSTSIEDQASQTMAKVSTLNDVTERRLLQEQIQKANLALEKRVKQRTAELEQALTEVADSEKMLRAILDVMPIAVVVFHLNHKVYSNRNLKTGRPEGIEQTPEEFRNTVSQFLYRKGTDMLYPYEEVPSIVALGGVAVEATDIEHRSIDGERRPFEVYARPLRNSTGDVVASVTVAVDTSEHEQYEKQLIAARSSAEIAKKSQERFLANMSHEIRTPMNAILGFAQILEREAGLAGVYQDNVQTILKSGHHLLALINDVLDLSKIESGYETLNEDFFNPSDVVTTITAMFQEQARQKNLKFEVNSRDLPESLRGDEDKIRQIVINLVSNALKFTDAGSVFCSFYFDQALKTLEVTVEDTGCGIDRRKFRTLFEPFEQDTKGKSGVKGSGLGLSISDRLAKLMGGEISLSSHLGSGTTFSFRVPLESGSSLSTTDTKRRVVSLKETESARQVLIVDDDQNSSSALEQFLTGMGFNTTTANSGQAALSIIKESTPDVIFLDKEMDGMDGFETLQRINETIEIPIPFIMLSASAFVHDRTRALSSGVRGFLSKPYLEADVLRTISSVLAVEYEYEELVEEPGHVDLVTDVARIDSMDSETIIEFVDAASSGDSDRLVRLIEESELDKSTRVYLNDVVKKFQHEKVLELFSATGAESGQGRAQ